MSTEANKRSKVEEEEEEEPQQQQQQDGNDDDVDVELELIQEEHRIWKKNSPYLYDVCLIHRSNANGYLTCDWLPTKTEHKGFSSQELVLGTKCNADQPNYLSVMKVILPPDEMEAAKEFNNERNELANYAKQELHKIQPICRMLHGADVDRARVMPNNPFVIATRMGTSIGVFKFDFHPREPKLGETGASPQILGLGHKEEGYALDWNVKKPEWLLSGGKDGAFVWNVDFTSSEMKPIKHFSSAVSDLAWDPHSEERFGAVNLQGGISSMYIWDSKANAPAFKMQSKDSSEELNAISFNPEKSGLFLTAGSSKMVRLWDERKPNSPVHDFAGHLGEIYGLAWAPFNSEVFASGGGDRRVMLWDINRVGAEQTEEEKEDGPAELVFVHGGHCGPVMDLAWNPNEDWMLASVSDDGDCGDLQIWRPADHCLGFDDQDDDDEDNDNEDDE